MTPKSKSNRYFIFLLAVFTIINTSYSIDKKDNFFFAEDTSSFESSLDGWTQGSGDELNWTRDSGGTPSNGTGPTSGSNGSFYMYIEASSSTSTEGFRAFLEKDFDLTNQVNASISFDYHMYSNNVAGSMGTLKLLVSSDNGITYTDLITPISGNQGNNWISSGIIDLSAYDGQNIRLRFEGTIGGNGGSTYWSSDIAIDNVSVLSDDSAITTQGFSFEDASLDGWIQGNGDELNWTRDANGTPSNGTGPSNASDGSFYMYIEASNSTSTEGFRAFLERDFDFTGQTNASIAFDYHMYSNNTPGSMGTLKLLVSTDNGANYTEVITPISGNQGNNWLSSGTIDLSSYDGQNIRIRFEGVIGGNGGNTYWSSDIAIDNVVVTSETAVGTPITVTADTATKVVGETDPIFTYSITSGNLEPGDSLTGSLSRVAGETVGTYAITQGTLNNPNYIITFVSATFTITEKDTDNDGVPDRVDLDDDNDGILDTDEGCLNPESVISGFAFTGSATSVSPTEVRLVPNSNNQAGLAMSTNRINFLENFTFRFDAFFGTQDANGADGIGLIFHNDPAGVNAFGKVGAGLGMQSIQNGIVIEFDTFQNENFGDIGSSQSTDHTRVYDSDTGLIDFATGTITITPPTYLTPQVNLGNIEDGQTYTVEMNWNAATNVLTYNLFDSSNNLRGSNSLTNDLIANFFGNENNIYFGVSASTGGFTNEHRVGNFQISCTQDTDNDGVIDSLDLDTDNDGIPDNIEAQTTNGYIAPTGNVGANGVDSAYESNDTKTATALTPVNTDSTDNPDYLDTDSENDGILDIIENGKTINAISGIDTDEDGLDNAFENGSTNDGYNINDGLIPNATNLGDEDGDFGTGGDVDYRDQIDTDNDGIADVADLDDDNDGILDTEEICIIPGAETPEIDRITFSDADFDIFTIGGNSGALGYQESGFQQAAYERGINLTVANTNNDFTFTPLNPTEGTATSSTGSFANGNLTYTSNAANIATRENLFTEGTINSKEAIIIEPSTNLISGEVYTVTINFNTAVYAFNFDLVGILDTGIGFDPNTVIRYEIFADSKRVGYFQNNTIGANNTATVDFFDDNNMIRGQMLVGHNIESAIGFITNSAPVSTVEIVHHVISGSPTQDLHFLNGFAWATEPQTCFASNIDFDGDGINNDKDLDSDNDGIPDNVEAQSTIEYIAPSYIYGVNGLDTAYGSGLTPINTNATGNADYISLDSDGDGVFDTNEVDLPVGFDIDNDGMSDGTVGKNGLDNTLYTADDFLDINGNINDPRNLPDIDGDVLTIGDVDYRDTHLSGTPLITQIFQTNASKSIEITNIHPSNSILANTIKISLYSNKIGDQSNIIPDEVFIINTDILPGASVVLTDLNIVNISNGDDIILLTHPKGNNTNNTAYNNRYDTTENINDNTIYVRYDEIQATSSDFNSSEWIAFIDDNLDPYADTPERHPHDPLLSEINSANPSSNLALGVHNIGITIRSGNTWTNGSPDRTRRVVISEDFETSDIVKARNLTINSNSKLTVNNNLLVVTDDIVMTDNTSEIRLVGSSQLIQTHTSTSKVSGSGNLLKDQNSEIASVYRFNYMSSPVGGNSFNLSSNLKDGSTALSATSNITDINFVGGLDGAKTSPISIASRWVFTFESADNELSNWSFKGDSGTINATDGFILKGPGTAQNYTFVGLPNDGTLTTSIGGFQSYLLGNPYPSAINAKKFIEDNISSISGTLYFWQHAGETDTSTEAAGHSYSGYVGGYSTRNITMGLAANSVSTNTEFSLGNNTDFYVSPENYIAVGQGFFVLGTEAGGQIEFNNAQREFITEGSESVFFKGKKEKQKSNQIPIIKLGLDYNTDNNQIMHRQIGISFIEGNTNAFEPGYDSYLFDQSFTDFYWKFPESEDKLVIAGVTNLSEELEVPIEITIGNDNELIIGVDEWNITGYNIYLYDSVLDIYYDITEEKTNISLIKGVYENRFYITFLEKNTLKTQKEIKLNLNAYYNTKTKNIQIENKQNITIQSVTLYNIIGQKVNEWNTILNKESKIELKTNVEKNNIYILKIKTENSEFTKKLIIE